MRKYNVENYIRYKEDVKSSMPNENKNYDSYTRDEMIAKFLTIGRKFS